LTQVPEDETEGARFLLALYWEDALEITPLAIMSNLKEMAREIQRGRPRWVLATAMPLRDDFSLYIAGDAVKPSKVPGKRIDRWVRGRTLVTVPDPAPDNLQVPARPPTAGLQARYDRLAVVRDAWATVVASVIWFRLLNDRYELAAWVLSEPVRRVPLPFQAGSTAFVAADRPPRCFPTRMRPFREFQLFRTMSTCWDSQSAMCSAAFLRPSSPAAPKGPPIPGAGEGATGR
jgi:hypothetical protein